MYSQCELSLPLEYSLQLEMLSSSLKYFWPFLDQALSLVPSCGLHCSEVSAEKHGCFSQMIHSIVAGMSFGDSQPSLSSADKYFKHINDVNKTALFMLIAYMIINKAYIIALFIFFCVE